jgi:hypothetical protein
MKNPSERFMPGRAPDGAEKEQRHPILPTVFMRGPALTEQLRSGRDVPIPGLSFSELAEDITKKSGELRGQLHEMKYSPARVSPFTVQEAELVLMHADRLLPRLQASPVSVAPDVAQELKYRAVDLILMLDAATRALKTP